MRVHVCVHVSVCVCLCIHVSVHKVCIIAQAGLFVLCSFCSHLQLRIDSLPGSREPIEQRDWECWTRCQPRRYIIWYTAYCRLRLLLAEQSELNNIASTMAANILRKEAAFKTHVINWLLRPVRFRSLGVFWLFLRGRCFCFFKQLLRTICVHWNGWMRLLLLFAERINSNTGNIHPWKLLKDSGIQRVTTEPLLVVEKCRVHACIHM